MNHQPHAKTLNTLFVQEILLAQSLSAFQTQRSLVSFSIPDPVIFSFLSIHLELQVPLWIMPLAFPGLLYMCVCVLSHISCVWLCDSMDCSPPVSSVHGILQARILGWVVMPFSRGPSWPRDWTSISCITGRSFTDWATKKALDYFISTTKSHSLTLTQPLEIFPDC